MNLLYFFDSYIRDKPKPFRSSRRLASSHTNTTTTALHEINNTITKGLKKKKNRTVAIALDLSKAFDTVTLHTLIHKLHSTNIPNTILKFIANYIKGRKQYTLYNNHKSTLRNTKTRVPQGGVLSPTLFNIYTTDLPTPTSPNITIVTYTDDTTILHANPHIAQRQVQPYLQEIYDWTKNHDHTLHTRPSRIQHNTYTTNQQHHFTHKQRAKNPSPNTRPETKLLKTHSKHNTKSQANNLHYESTHNNTLGEVQRNTQHNIQNNSQTHSRICQHNLVPHHIKHKHEQITNNTKLSTPKNNRMHTRHKRTSPAHRNKNSPHRHTHETP